jgi:hypothetical protein
MYTIIKRKGVAAMTKPSDKESNQQKSEEEEYQEQIVKPASYEELREMIGTITKDEADEFRRSREKDWERKEQ